MKVFCVGLEKTGTTSLAVALGLLGLKVHPGASKTRGRFSVNNPEISTVALGECSRRVAAWDAFIQHPWAWLWPHWYIRYPDAKFVLTVRDTDEWWESNLAYFKDSTVMREWVYGAGNPEGNEALYREVFEEHNRRVAESIPGVLVLNIPAGDGWGKLCGFLGVDVPDVEFPHLNRRLS